jgi:hypothetical protein
MSIDNDGGRGPVRLRNEQRSRERVTGMASSLTRGQRVAVLLSVLWLIGGGLWGNNREIHEGDWITFTVLVLRALTTLLAAAYMPPLMLARATSLRDGTHGLKGNTA